MLSVISIFTLNHFINLINLAKIYMTLLIRKNIQGSYVNC